MPTRLRDLFEHELAGWRVPAWLAAVLLAFPMVGGVGLILTRVASQDAYTRVIREDGPIEWASFACWMVTAVAGTFLALRLWRSGRTLEACFWSVVVIASFCAGGEEISWGQRVLGFGTPSHLREMNDQGEVNLHNLASLDNGFRVVMLLLGLYGSAFALAVRWRSREAGNDTVELLIPPLFLFSMFFLIAAFRLTWFVLLAPRPLRDTPVSYGEWAEMCVALGMAAFASLGLRRLSFAGHARQPAMDRSARESTMRVGHP